MESLLVQLNQYGIYFNFFSLGSLVVSVFTGFLAVFTLTIRNRSRATIDLGLVYLWFALFFSGYVVAAAFYSPLAVYHRFLTLGFIFPALLHFNQWIFRFPENTHPRLQRTFLIVQYLIAFAIMGAFIYATRQAGIKFHFNGHYWDFDAELFSRIAAYWIMAYILSIPAIAIWKIRVTRELRHRLSIAGILGCLVAGGIIPGILNALSRDGVVDRGFYLNALVLLALAAFFALTILFINTTEDRTTFMAKIVGITMVTFLLLFQGMAYVSMEDREAEYDRMHRYLLIRAIEGGTIDEELAYLYVYREAARTGELEYSQRRYYTSTEERKIPFAQAETELRFTILRQRIAELDGDGIPMALQEINRTAPVEFSGYGGALVRFAQTNAFRNNPTAAAMQTEIERLNRLTFVARTRTGYIAEAGFRSELLSHLEGIAGPELPSFHAAILGVIQTHPELDGRELKQTVLAYFAPFEPEQTRHYRSSADGRQNFIAYTVYVPESETVYEAGFFYEDYRAFIHRTAFKEVTLLAAVLFVVLFLFPLFFRGAFILPLRALIDGVSRVNQGDLTIRVPVKVQDEIGFLGDSFNRMVISIAEARDQLRDHANNLESHVKARTAELNSTLDQIRELKTQQDGDYFLTSLLMKPLNFNANKSTSVHTDFIIIQKKQFEFRGRQADLGGDICLTGNLRLGTPTHHRRYTVAVNADAMGKSMQGAGGALVMGVVMNSIIARSARQDRVLDQTPEEWLADVYTEVNGVFLAFAGTMVISAVIDLIDEESGEVFYFNAEHPFQVIYRNGQARYLEEDLQLRKFGLDSEIAFAVKKFQLLPGDVLLLGSDGRDDIDLTPNDDGRKINDDETMFLGAVEEARAELPGIVDSLRRKGELTDDLSLLRIAFQPTLAGAASAGPGSSASLHSDSSANTAPPLIEPKPIEDHNNTDAFALALEQGQRLLRMGRGGEALEALERAHALRQDHTSLNRTLAILTFREKDYEKAVAILERYLVDDPSAEDFWLYLSIAQKRLGNMDRALEAALRVYERNEKRIPNLLQLADLYHRKGESATALQYLARLFEIDPMNSQGKTLEQKIAGSQTGSLP